MDPDEAAERRTQKRPWSFNVREWRREESPIYITLRAVITFPVPREYHEKKAAQ
jgi:hypothetical protein